MVDDEEATAENAMDTEVIIMLAVASIFYFKMSGEKILNYESLETTTSQPICIQLDIRRNVY